MRIIEDKTAKEYTCVYCGSVLEVNAMDIWHNTSEYDGHIINREYYVCPCCGNQNIIKDEVI